GPGQGHQLSRRHLQARRRRRRGGAEGQSRPRARRRHGARPASVPEVEIGRRAGASSRGALDRSRRWRRAMTALADPPAGLLLRGAAFSGRGLLPTLLLLPCLIWISFFFL